MTTAVLHIASRCVSSFWTTKARCVKSAAVAPTRIQLRAFDCKNEACAHVMESAPKITDHLCDDCREHYEQVKALLDAAGVKYIEDPTLVRGLDYYTRTVFEVQVVEGMGSQSAIGGGGRYDKLAEIEGGRPTPGLGFALGFERMVLALEAAGTLADSPKRVDGYIACVDPSVARYGLRFGVRRPRCWAFG